MTCFDAKVRTAVSAGCGAGLARYASAAQHGADSPERAEAPYGAVEDGFFLLCPVNFLTTVAVSEKTQKMINRSSNAAALSNTLRSLEKGRSCSQHCI